MMRRAKRFVGFRKSSFSSLIPHPSSFRSRDTGFWCRLLFQQWKNFFDQRVGGNSVLLSQERNRAVFDELIRPTNSRNGSIDLLRMQMFHDRAAEAIVEYVIFDRSDHFHAPCEELERASVHRFDPARIDQRD